MTAIASLPPETLSHIFTLAIGPYPSPDLREAPINVSQTCCLWREILLSGGQFWSSFYAGEAGMPVPDEISAPGLLWLQRARNASLRCALRFHDAWSMDEPECNSQSDRLLSALSAKQRLWESVTIRDMPENIRAIVLSRLPRLTHLDISAFLHHLFRVHENAIGERVDCDAAFVLSRRELLSGPLAPRLTTLAVEFHEEMKESVNGLFTFLQSSPKLLTLSISTIDEIHEEITDLEGSLFLDSEEHIILHELRTLQYDSAHTRCFLLAWMKTPRLERLYLGATVTQSSPNADYLEKPHIIDYLRKQCNSQIESVIVQDIALAGPLGIELLEALPNVKCLAFEMGSDTLFDRFVDVKRPTLLCPRLTTLKLKFSFPSADLRRMNELASMLRRRTRLFPDFEATIIIPGLDDLYSQFAEEISLLSPARILNYRERIMNRA